MRPGRPKLSENSEYYFFKKFFYEKVDFFIKFAYNIIVKRKGVGKSETTPMETDTTPLDTKHGWEDMWNFPLDKS